MKIAGDIHPAMMDTYLVIAGGVIFLRSDKVFAASYQHRCDAPRLIRPTSNSNSLMWRRFCRSDKAFAHIDISA